MAWFTAKSASFWQSNLPYILVRLFAVLGVLLALESLFGSHFSPPEIPPLDRSRYTHLYENDTSPLNPNVVEEETRPGGIQTEGGVGSKAIIASCLKADVATTNWIHELLPDWEAAVYVVNDPHGNLTVAKNKGREASVYLTYIIDHYDNLPDVMVFIHGRRYQWHSDDPMYDTLPEIANLSLSYVQESGYTSLRCTWEPGCPYALRPNADPNHHDGFFAIDGLYASAWKVFFPKVKVPRRIAAPCCAQFAVSRDQVLARPLSDYKKYRRWLWNSNDYSMKTGYVMEYTWHVIFGRAPIYCNISAKQCFCKKFGLCDLKCPQPGFCKGRYIQKPFNKSLPTNWPQEGQGKWGNPVDGWWNNVT